MWSMLVTNSFLLFIVTPVINVSLALSSEIDPGAQVFVDDDDCGVDAVGSTSHCALSALQRGASQLKIAQDSDDNEDLEALMDDETLETSEDLSWMQDAANESLNRDSYHPCTFTGYYMYPNSGHRSHEASAADCQDRCERHSWCGYFSFWPDHGCRLQSRYGTYGRKASYHYRSVVGGRTHCHIHGSHHHHHQESSTTHAIHAQPTTTHAVASTPQHTMTVYHQTSPEACQGILATGFRLGHGGWCGNAIYFALSPESTKTKAITPHSGSGCMLEAVVNIGHQKKYPCCQYCGGRKGQHIYWTRSSLKQKGYDSIWFDPGDGPEVIIYSKEQIVSIKTIPFNPAWTPKKMKGNW